MRTNPRKGETVGIIHRDWFEYELKDIIRISGSYYKYRALVEDGCRGCIDLIDFLVDYERAGKELNINLKRMTEIDCQKIVDYLNGGRQ